MSMLLDPKILDRLTRLVNFATDDVDRRDCIAALRVALPSLIAGAEENVRLRARVAELEGKART